MLTLTYAESSGGLEMSVSPVGAVGPRVGKLVIGSAKFVGNGPFNLISFGGPVEFDVKTQKNRSLDLLLVSRYPEDQRSLIPFLNAALKETREAVELFVTTFG